MAGDSGEWKGVGASICTGLRWLFGGGEEGVTRASDG